MNNATINADSSKVITNIGSLTQKRNKPGASSYSGNHTPYGVGSSQARGEDSPVGTSPALRPRVSNLAKPGSCSPVRESPTKMAAMRQQSREKPLKPYVQSGHAQPIKKEHYTQNNFQTSMTSDSQEMNSLLKSPNKTNMRQLPNLPSGSGKKGAVAGDHSAAMTTVVNPTSFVVQF